MRRDRVNNPITDALTAFGVLLAVSLAAFGLLVLADRSRVGNPLHRFAEPGAVDTLTSFSEVTVGVLGIAITVVAIIVELAATRYTPRITELFVNDPINRAAMSLFVLTSVLVVWINVSLHGPQHPARMALAATVLMSLSVLAILPYFAYVFDFLSPTRVIQRIQQKASHSIDRLARQVGKVSVTRTEVATSIEQLGDIALNSVDKKDKPLTIASVNALAAIARSHLTHKGQLSADWFDSSVLVRTDQDFIAFHPDIVRTLTHRHTWVEMKILRQYQAVFVESLNRTRDINHLLAIQTRRVSLFALDQGDLHGMNLCNRFLNTYMRAAVNAGDLRTCYNLLNEYRALAEAIAARDQDDVVLELAERIKYYGQLAFSRKLAFILETAAYDLCALLEQVSDRGNACHDPLLELFLDVDREPEGGKTQETALRGVRKAQIKLATYYLVKDKQQPARRIFEDMRGEQPDRLTSIRAELEAVDSAEFWEVSDRGINFEYLTPDRRSQLDTFFRWFEDAPS